MTAAAPPPVRRLGGSRPAQLAPQLRRLWVLVLTVFTLAWAVPARAGEPATNAPASSVEKSPADVPMVVQPSAIVLPPLPETDQVRDLGWIKIAYPPSVHERVQTIVDDADDVKAQLADELGQPVFARPIEVRVARSPEDMAALMPADVQPPAYASAIAVPGLRLVVLSLRAPVSDEGTDLGQLFRHELAHIALDDAMGSKHVPFWFNEGYAMHASNEHALDRMEALSKATLYKTIIPLSELDRSSPTDEVGVSVAYAESADFVRFLLRRADRARFAQMIERTRKGEPFDRALGDAYSSDIHKLEYEWREELAKRYTFWPVLLGGSSLWVLVAGALALGWHRKKKYERGVIARWEREEREEAEGAARRAAIRAAVQSDPPPAEMRPVNVPKIEHEGDWHTLH